MQLTHVKCTVVSFGVFAESHVWPLAHTALRTSFLSSPTPVPVASTRLRQPQTCSCFYLFFWTFPFQVPVQVLGVPGVGV